MTDVSAETPAELVPPAQVPEAAEPEAGPRDNVENLHVETVEAPGAPAAEHVMPELEQPIGALRQRILDHLVDTEGEPQSVAQIIAGLGGTVSRNTVESAIRRNLESGLIERTRPGHYQLAKSGPAKSAPPPVPPPDEAVLFAALERSAADPASWDVSALGPPPGDENTQISLDIRRRFYDRIRKREERRKDAEAALERARAAPSAIPCIAPDPGRTEHDSIVMMSLGRLC